MLQIVAASIPVEISAGFALVAVSACLARFLVGNSDAKNDRGHDGGCELHLQDQKKAQVVFWKYEGV